MITPGKVLMQKMSRSLIWMPPLRSRSSSDSSTAFCLSFSAMLSRIPRSDEDLRSFFLVSDLLASNTVPFFKSSEDALFLPSANTAFY